MLPYEKHKNDGILFVVICGSLPLVLGGHYCTQAVDNKVKHIKKIIGHAVSLTSAGLVQFRDKSGVTIRRCFLPSPSVYLLRY